MSTREMKIAAVYSEGKTLEVYDKPNTNWIELPGFMDWTPSGGERDTRSTGTDSTRPHGVVSNPKAPTLECTFKYIRGAVWDLIDDAFIKKTTLSFRMRTAEEEVYPEFAGNTCAISATGVCTLVTGTNNIAPTIDELPVGSDIVIGGTAYGIASVSDLGIVTVDRPSAAVTAAAYKVATPAEQVSFRGKIAIAPPRQHTLAQQSEREGSLTIQALGLLPTPQRVG